MPILIAIPIVLIVLAIGAWRLYEIAVASIGMPLATLAAIVILVLLVAGVTWRIRAYRAVHGVRKAGQPSHQLENGGTRLLLNAAERRATVEQGGKERVFIFADIESVQAIQATDGWTLVLALKHTQDAEVRLPMRSQAEARRWVKILTLAAAQKL